MLPTTTRRKFLRFTLAGAGASVLAACAGTTQVVEKEVVVTQIVEKVVEASAAPEEQHSITFAWWTGGEGANKVFEEAIDRFELSHPNYSVNRISVPGGGEFTTKMLTMYGAGNAPDCHGIQWGPVWAFAHKGILKDLTPLAERDEADVRLDEMWPAITGMLYYPAGKLVALPRETFGLYIRAYNKTLFEEMGVELPNAAYPDDWTWEKWRETALAVTKFGDDGRRETMGASQGVDLWSLATVLPSLGVPMFSEDQGHFNLDAEPVMEWLQMIHDMVAEDQSIGKSEETKEFDWASSGKLGIQHDATWGIPNMRETWADFEWDFVPPPKGTTYANVPGCDFHVVNGSDYADFEGGWELIKFLNSEAEDLWWGVNMFGPPFRQPNVEPWTTKVAEVLPKDGWQYIGDMTAAAVSWPNAPFYTELDAIHSNEIGQAVTGERTVEDVVTSIVTKTDEMIAAFE